MIPETLEDATTVKARGGFYTPATVTRFIADWAVRSADDRTLEPACGDGAFVAAARERYLSLGRTNVASCLIGVEREPLEAAKASVIGGSADIHTRSFFDLGPEDLGRPFDAVIGNPPYIRYHGFTGDDRKRGLERALASGVQLTRLASSWAHFVAHATSFLADSGRLGLVLPAELLVTDYAQPVRAHLLARFSSVVIVAFDHMVFHDAQVDAVLLLASSDSNNGLRIVRVPDADSLRSLRITHGTDIGTEPGQRWISTLDAGIGSVYRALEDSHTTLRLGDVASVDIGVVTGANSFFILDADEAARRQLADQYLLPIVERPADVPGLTVAANEQRRLLMVPSNDPSDDPHIQKYLRRGRRERIHQRYKCRIRRTWYSVPTPRRRADAFLPYMTGDAPRLIVNSHVAWSTNLLHGVTLLPNGPDVRALSAAMLSSITLLSAEVEGRAYGGGVLKMETREAEQLLVPFLSAEQASTLARLHPELDRLFRSGQAETASRIVDAILGIDTVTLQAARAALRSRRIGRRRAKAAIPIGPGEVPAAPGAVRSESDPPPSS